MQNHVWRHNLCIYIFVQQWNQNHVEGYLELSAKTKTYFATAVALWDAEFYVKVDDDVHVNLGKLRDEFFSIVHVESELQRKTFF